MLTVEDNVKIEITVRTSQDSDWKIPDFFKKFLDGKKKDKFIFMVPQNWEGFENGYVKQLIKSDFDVYLALAYSTTGNEKVEDKDGNEIRPFVHHFLGGVIYKYVKKELVISINAEGIVNAYTITLNINENNPVNIEKLYPDS